MITGTAAHYQQAERLLDAAAGIMAQAVEKGVNTQDALGMGAHLIAQAQAHATLALVQATEARR